ncbi:MAG: UvrB/UvrC motif-containing protein, partial [Armatimonadetes bacterium]|nr:UvrB/UvrC motif-containing protein [Armatimonadota bacterium]
DRVTDSMQNAIDETARRREIQQKYNEENGVSPRTIDKRVYETVRSYDAVAEVAAQYDAATMEAIGKDGQPVRIEDIPLLIGSLEKDMKDFAKAMEFEKAAGVRDEIKRLREIMGVSDGRIGTEKRKRPDRFTRQRERGK